MPSGGFDYSQKNVLLGEVCDFVVRNLFRFIVAVLRVKWNKNKCNSGKTDNQQNRSTLVVQQFEQDR